MNNKYEKGTLGGQAVMEGVMMKGPKAYSVAVRKPDQKIEVKMEDYTTMAERYVLCRLPFIRGVFSFIESLFIGMKTLTYSSSFYEEETESKTDRLFKDIFKEKAESVIIGLTVLVSVIIAIALFVMFPAVIAELLKKSIKSHVFLSIIEGFIRLFIFIIYVLLISQMQDIKRLFMYHGAEHKTINCYEAGKDLTTENIQRFSRYHKRCGTSFVFFVMVVSIFVFMFITTDMLWLRLVFRLLLIPIVASISYEMIRFAGKNDNLFSNALSLPGMWIQKLTTKEPTEEMIQVAIIAVESILYGNAYVDAVNEAQGLKKKDETPTLDENHVVEIEADEKNQILIESFTDEDNQVIEYDEEVQEEQSLEYEEDNDDQEKSTEELDKEK